MPPFLARENAFEVVSKYLHRSRDGSDFTFAIVVLSGILGVWLLLNWFENYRTRSKANAQSVGALFLELCRAHRLSRGERQMLERAAHGLGARCCEIFVDPRILGKLSVARNPDADSYGKLARKLFNDG